MTGLLFLSVQRCLSPRPSPCPALEGRMLGRELVADSVSVSCQHCNVISLPCDAHISEEAPWSVIRPFSLLSRFFDFLTFLLQWVWCGSLWVVLSCASLGFLGAWICVFTRWEAFLAVVSTAVLSAPSLSLCF